MPNTIRKKPPTFFMMVNLAYVSVLPIKSVLKAKQSCSRFL